MTNTTQNDILLQLKNVTCSFKNSTWKLHPQTLQISPGLTGFIGPNGAGKSTLLKIAAGILPPQNGTVKLNNRNINTIPRNEIAKIIAYLPQTVDHTFEYTVEQVVSMGRFPTLQTGGFLTATDINIIKQALEQTETLPYRGRKLSELSGGERQRVLLASVLTQQPRILLLDEPTTGLDLHHQVKFFRLLKTLSAKNITIVIVTHDLNLAAQFCDNLLLLNNGSKVIYGPPKKVIHPNILAPLYQNTIYITQHPLNNMPIVLPRL